MLKFHQQDDIFYLRLRPLDEGTRRDVTAVIPGGFVGAGEVIRLIAPMHSVDHRIRVLTSDREVTVNGDFATIDGEFVD